MAMRHLKTLIMKSFIVIIAVLSFSIALFGFYVIKKDIIDIAQIKVKSDLALAREIYREETRKIEDSVRFAASRSFLRDAILNNDVETIKKSLDAAKKAESLDILTLTDKEGSVVLRVNNPSFKNDNQAVDEVVSRAFADKKVISATTIVPKAELEKEGADLTERAYIKFINTPKAKPTANTEQTAGIMIKAAAPVFDNQNNLIGVLYGGTLLNRNYRIVDRVKEIIYQDATYKGKNVGTVTIFQGDLRISTNVIGTDGNRAIGTRVSEDVYNRVLGQGQPWVNRAFVVNDWYKTAYEPIRNIDGQIIGILYVGTLERPYKDILTNAMLIFLAIIAAAVVLAIVLSVILATGISRPVTDVFNAATKLSTGELGHTIETKSNIAELNQLVRSFNEMSQQLNERDKSLKLSNDLLADLNKRYIDLIGFVSHELKGSVATIVMNVYSVRDNILGAINEKQKKALDGAGRALDYLTATIKKILSLGQIEKGELEAKKTTVELRKSVFDVVINSVSNLVSRKNMRVRNEIEDDLKVIADADLIQIVANNLVSNAVKYGKEEGEIAVRSQVKEDAIEIEVYNESVPIKEQDKDRLFKRFSRLDNPETHNVKGTGLGLFIVKQIIEKHGGRIWVEPKEKGNSFIFQLPLPKQSFLKESMHE
jgi:two-component system, NtrC family, sensor kinase